MWNQIAIITNHKQCIGGKLFVFNYKHNLISKDIFTYFSFTSSICTFEYNHSIELRIEEWKGTSHFGAFVKQFKLSWILQKPKI
jgi:hypothetical protein